jgi:chaperonin GroES
MSVKIRPLGDRVIIQRLEEEEKSAGGILIPDSAKEKPIRGKIVAIGKGKRLDNGDVRPLDVEIGHIVFFGKYAGTEIKVDNEELVVLREEDIMGIQEG